MNGRSFEAIIVDSADILVDPCVQIATRQSLPLSVSPSRRLQLYQSHAISAAVEHRLYPIAFHLLVRWPFCSSKGRLIQVVEIDTGGGCSVLDSENAGYFYWWVVYPASCEDKLRTVIPTMVVVAGRI